MMLSLAWTSVALLIALGAETLLAATSKASLHTATLYHAPLSTSTPSPAPLAVLTYDPTRPHSSKIEDLTPPANVTLNTQSPFDLTRIITYLPGTSAATLEGRSSVTAIVGFYAPYKGRFRLLVDTEGHVLGASYRSWLPQNGAEVVRKGDQRGEFDVVVQSPPPQVVFDQPKGAAKAGGAGVAGPGAAEGEGEEPAQKTFLQKYWWLLIGVAVIVMTGGGGEK